MRKLLSGFCATAMAATFAISSIAPVAAAPVFIPKAVEASTDIQLANHTPEHRRWLRMQRRQDRREFRQELRQDRREFRREARQDRREFRREGNYAWYGQHRGYRYYRPGYREYNGYWFPAAAFLAGALITGAIVNNNNNYNYGGNSHVSWCYDRYRSYRASDNTFQPYNGPRQQCYSPYS
jgi:hypothetical protein